MSVKLGVKLTINFLLVALATIVLVSLLTNYALDFQFEQYLMRVDKEQNQRIVASIEAMYQETGSWSGIAPRVEHLTVFSNRAVRIEDLTGEVVLETNMMRRGMMMHTRPRLGDEAFTTVEELRVDGQLIGKVYITSLRSIQGVYSQEDMLFRETINRSIVSAGILATLIALGISIFLSNRLTGPLRTLTTAARTLGKGDLSKRVEVEGTDEIAMLSSSFNEMADSLEQLEGLRKKLTADVSHELRTPLTTIQGYIEGMRDGVLPTDNENLTAINEEIHRLTGLVEALQELANAEAPIWHGKSFNLVRSLDKVITQVRPLFTNKGVELRTAMLAQEIILIGDELRLARAIYNILINAVKYTPAGGTVGVQLDLVDKRARIRISDTGPGIKDQDLPYIFERFYRADQSRARKTGGSGIGLTIARETILAHQGTIEVDSKVGQGTTFTINLPYHN